MLPRLALTLLRSLLAPEPAERPRHAVDISRMIAAVRAAKAAPRAVSPAAPRCLSYRIGSMA
ncbi:hypothetical protein LP420_01700 [Massilia sp. B-10]|nr:hypothetical protein LP420_01700 [Massilia sp. B-10]